MESIASRLRKRRWTKDSLLISTDVNLIPIPELLAFFSAKGFYWANPLPEDTMKETLQNSLCFALYDIKDDSLEMTEELLRARATSPDSTAQKSTPELLGFARMITDFVTFAFVTDVWIDPLAQGKGLGTWLVGCVQEVIESMPHLRRSMLLTSSWEKSVPFYQRLMKMTLMNERTGDDLPAVMQMKWKGQVDWVEPDV